MPYPPGVQRLLRGATCLIWLGLATLPALLPVVARAQETPAVQASQPDSTVPQTPAPSVGQQTPPATAAQPTTPPPAGQQAAPQGTGQISGTVVDQTGALAVGAKVQLTHDDKTPAQEAVSGDNGEYSFSNVPTGAFHITATATGFTTGKFSGQLNPGQDFVVPKIAISLANAVTEVKVGGDSEEVAEEEVHEQLQQRVFGFIPNFYVTYVPDAAPLHAKQKFYLAWRSNIDPITIVGAGFLAGLEQASDDFPGYGQGAQGYAKRFGASYADVFIGTFMDSAVLTTVFKQDPRYFYQGTGTTKSRLLHALGNAIVCKGDNKQTQVNYSAILGAFATGGISYLYYPASDRGIGLLVQNAAVRIGLGSVAGVFQEFVLQRYTSRARQKDPSQAQTP